MSRRRVLWAASVVSLGTIVAGTYTVFPRTTPHERGARALRVENGIYRASFARLEGVTFTSRIEGGHSEGLTWRYRARALVTGHHIEPLMDVEPVTTTAADHVVEFRRPGVIERYIGRLQGLEQVFVLTERPRRRGDVRVRGDVTFAGRAMQTAWGLEFSPAEGKGLTYSRPVAFDATRRAIPARAELRGATLDLVLDGAALEGAAFPVTIDPLLSGPTTTFTGHNARNVDLAWNWTLGEFLLVFSAESDSDSTKREIRVKRFNAAGVPVSSSSVISSGPNLDLPKVAYNLEIDRYLVVWQREEFLALSVGARILASNGRPLSSEFQVNAANTYAVNPDVTARSFVLTRQPADTTRFLVVWRASTDLQNFHVERAHVSADGSSLIRAQLSTSLPGFDPDRVDQAAAYDPRLDRFFVVWSHAAQTRGRSIDAATGEHGPQMIISNFLGPHPDVAIDSRWWFVAGDDRVAFLHPGLNPTVAAEFATSIKNPAITTEVGGFLFAGEADSFDLPYLAFTYRADTDLTFFPIPSFEYETESSTATVRPALATNQYGFSVVAYERCIVPTQSCPDDSPTQEIRIALVLGSFVHFVHGSGGDFDGDGGTDLFAFRPSTGAWRVRTGSGESSYAFGAPGDIPVLMDVNNNGTADLGVFRPSNGTWYVWPQPNSREPISIVWGKAGDIPVPGDYVGDGTDDQAVFRPTTGTWYIRDGATGEITSRQWGEIGDVPVPADYDGDGKVDLCVWREGNWLKIRVDGSNQANVFGWGERGDIPLQGNFVGSAPADQVFFRPNTAEWFIRNGATGSTTTVAFDTDLSHGDGIPMPVDWDEDGRLNLAVWHPTSGNWFIRQGTSTFAISFGSSGDIPAGGHEPARKRGGS